jgi:hypothetical protein
VVGVGRAALRATQSPVACVRWVGHKRRGLQARGGEGFVRRLVSVPGPPTWAAAAVAAEREEEAG